MSDCDCIFEEEIIEEENVRDKKKGIRKDTIIGVFFVRPKDFKQE